MESKDEKTVRICLMCLMMLAAGWMAGQCSNLSGWP